MNYKVIFSFLILLLGHNYIVACTNSDSSLLTDVPANVMLTISFINEPFSLLEYETNYSHTNDDYDCCTDVMCSEANNLCRHSHKSDCFNHCKNDNKPQNNAIEVNSKFPINDIIGKKFICLNTSPFKEYNITSKNQNEYRLLAYLINSALLI